MNCEIRLSWRLAQLSRATGLSLPFLRKEARLGRLATRKLGGAVIVLDTDARAYLAGNNAPNNGGDRVSDDDQSPAHAAALD